MAHGDDDGLVIPPLVAPAQVVIIPIVRNAQDAEAIHAYCDSLKKKIQRKKIKGQALRVRVDKSEINSGEKKWYHIKRGVPVRVEIGIKELEQNTVSFSRRDNIKEVIKTEAEDFIKSISRTLLDIQASMLKAAKVKLAENTEKATTLESFKNSLKRKDKLNSFVLAPFVEDDKVKTAIDELGVTVRCIPLVQPKESATCLFTGKKTGTWALYAKAY